MGRTRNPLTKPLMHFLGNSVKCEQNACYFSVAADAKLNGLAHLEYIKQSIVHYVWALHSLSRRDWGLKGSVLKHLYIRGMERLATYACSFWWSGTGRMREKLASCSREHEQTLDDVRDLCRAVVRTRCRGPVVIMEVD